MDGNKKEIKKTFTFEEAQAMNRHERRALAKFNSSPKITGTTKPLIGKQK